MSLINQERTSIKKWIIDSSTKMKLYKIFNILSQHSKKHSKQWEAKHECLSELLETLIYFDYLKMLIIKNKSINMICNYN